MFYSFVLVLVSLIGFNAQTPRLAGECAMVCNDLRTTVLTMAICADAKKTLPRPKVGDFCSIAMEQGFSDACVSLCMGQPPTPRLAQTCRSASIEMPRPTVRKWCEHGYTVGFQKTVQDLRNYFLPQKEEKPKQEDVKIEPVFHQEKENIVPHVDIASAEHTVSHAEMASAEEADEQHVFESREDPVQIEELTSSVEQAETEGNKVVDSFVEDIPAAPIENVGVPQTDFDNTGSFEDQQTEVHFGEPVPEQQQQQQQEEGTMV